MKVHPTAVIAEGVELGTDVQIGPYAIVEEGARIGRACRLAAHAIVRTRSILGDGVTLDSFAAVGGDPQMVGFDREICSHVEIGEGSILREGVTVNRSTKEHGVTKVGAHCFLMACSHIGHDCIVGDHVTLANGVLLGGHITIGDHTFAGGTCGIHQFCRVGESVMLGGNGTITCDVPSFTIVAGRNQLFGLNLVGLRRRGFSREEIRDLKACLYEVFQSQATSPAKLAAAALKSGTPGQTAPGKRFLEFVTETKRGYAHPTKRT